MVLLWRIWSMFIMHNHFDVSMSIVDGVSVRSTVMGETDFEVRGLDIVGLVA